MDLIISIAAAYILFGFVRAIYRLATGFLYTPLIHKNIDEKYYSPLVSVVVPAWNEEVGIAKTIQSVMDNGYKNIEVIVIDDGSADDTAAVVKSLAKKYPRKIELERQPNGGKASALNTGIHQAKGSLILTIDADSYLELGSIQRMVNAMADNRYSVAIGEVVVGNTKSWLGRAQHFEYTIGFHVKRSQHVFDSAYIFPGALTMFRSSVLKEVGDFTHYSSTEDLDISMRIKMAGHKIAYVDSAICVTEGASTIKGLLNQRTRWRHGYIECLLHQRKFISSPKKGRYLTFVDLPLQIFGILELFMLPAILIILGYLLTQHANPLALLAAYCIVPLTLLMLGDLRDKHRQVNLWVFTMPVMLVVIEIIEYIALLKSIYRTVRRRRTEWTVWQRTGASS